MGLGILEPSNCENVPGRRSRSRGLQTYFLFTSLGTSFVLDDISRPADATHSTLKYDRNGPTPIILVPQPSDDPNDPLVLHP